MDMPEFTDKTRPFLALQDELRSGMQSDAIGFREMRDAALADMSGYFENTERLITVFDGYVLRFEHAFLQRNKAVPWVHNNLSLMLKEFREARDHDAGSCFKTWGSMMNSVDRGITNVSVVASLQQDIGRLSTEFTTKSILRDVGDVLEGSLQPLVRLRLAMQEVAGVRSGRPQNVADMSFGQVINELASRTSQGAIYHPSPFGISVSQWRNIANHNSYSVKDEEISFTYRSEGKQEQFSCTVSDLIDLAKYVDALGFLHKVAFEIFSIDNLNQLIANVPKVEITEYTKDAALVSGLFDAGMAIMNAAYREGEWALLLIDECCRNRDSIREALHEAVRRYFMLAGSTAFTAIVRSKSSEYRFSFRVSSSEKATDKSRIRSP